MDLTSFVTKLPPELNDLLEKADDFGLRPFFVGGVTRDFLYSGNVANDIDIEFHYDGEISDEDFQKLFSQFINYLRDEFEVTELGYRVHKIMLGNVSVEFTLPRKEVFIEGDHGHSNFEAKFGNFSLEESVRRRDFTINAIYFEFHNGKAYLHDPLGGARDLENKILRECSSDFSRDPVRFLRAYRFKVRFSMTFTKSLKKELKTINPDYISKHYWKNELAKTNVPWILFEELRSDYKKKFPKFEFIEKSHMLSVLDEWIDEDDHAERFYLSIAIDPYLGDMYKSEILDFFDISQKRYPFFPKNNKNIINTFLSENSKKTIEELAELSFSEELYQYYKSIVLILIKYPEHQEVIINVLKRLELHKNFLRAVKHFKKKVDLQSYPAQRRSFYHFLHLLKGIKS